MPNISLWSNVGVAVESSLASPQTITVLTKASEAVVTIDAHGYNDGDYVLITATGMTEVNGRIFRVDDKDTNTFHLEGENSTNYGAFVSGTAAKITFGNTMTTATGLSASGGDFSFVDTTTIHDVVKSQIPGVANPATYTFESFWDVADPALIAFKLASDAKAQRCVMISYSNGQRIVFTGYVGASLLPVGNAQDKVTTQVVITMFGKPTVYAT